MGTNGKAQQELKSYGHVGAAWPRPRAWLPLRLVAEAQPCLLLLSAGLPPLPCWQQLLLALPQTPAT